MTTDPFTEAANDAAREYARTPRMNVGTVQDRIGQAHADGWEAARTHLAAQEPTDAELEDAVASMKRQAPGDTPNWPEWVWVRFARVALSARAARRDEEKR